MKLDHSIAVFLLVWSSIGLAADPELRMLSEHPVEGMRGGNLSGLARCGEQLWTVSDRDDDQIYRLDTRDKVWKAEAVLIDVPTVPNDPGRTLAMQAQSALRALAGNGKLDFEGITCDPAGNLYVLSETYSAILRISPDGGIRWLQISLRMVTMAREAGLLIHANALFEGLIITGIASTEIWLAAERQKRGLVKIKRSIAPVYYTWFCGAECVVMTEEGLAPQPPQFPDSTWVDKDFSDIALFNKKLFLLDRNAFKICRHEMLTGKQERCWSFAADALVPSRQYAARHGMTEALLVDAQGAWIGVDNNFATRADGESRPIVWRFAAPAGGWDAGL
ncbi:MULTISPECIES: esterase-like activity of phytase family protein [unclassified Pseudomonas]|uniref:esterase-like activity of phytase family protein n=1 Tax=unclassified Pseudomonas TaxID=196821 RepID=UPI00215BD9BA|nr:MULTISPECIES: esterase-like activity of phytase family protein [unclassified Pseudomonas]MCR8933437.1 esterase-like activity of phytase family protein [Pseudomonas sp. S11A4]MCR8977042.1 esterase-like activity of phytase family protein [Pseudomonas sp. S11P7]